MWFKECPEAHEIFERDGCKIENGRGHVPSGVVAEALARRPDLAICYHSSRGLCYDEPLGVKQGETHFGLIDNAYYIYDFEANRSRDCIETDIADKLLVLDSSLTNIEYDCCNLFTTLGRGIGSPVVSTYDSSEACEVFSSGGRLRFCRSQRLPLSARNYCQEESRQQCLGTRFSKASTRLSLFSKTTLAFRG